MLTGRFGANFLLKRSDPVGIAHIVSKVVQFLSNGSEIAGGQVLYSIQRALFLGRKIRVKKLLEEMPFPGVLQNVIQ